MFRTLANAALVGAFLIAHAHGQTSPNLVRGQVLTADQWNALFVAKRDYSPNIPACVFTPCPPGPVTVGPNQVLVTDGSGHVVFQSTLPQGTTIPSPIFPGVVQLPAVQPTDPINVAWQFDASTQAPQQVASGGSLALPAGTGLLVMRNLANGDVGVYSCGLSCALLSSSGGTWTAPTTTPPAGQMSITITAGAATIYSNFGSSVTVSGALVKVN